jgi:GGDEF domain-containing protein
MDWTAWSSDPILGSWVPLLGVMIGASMFMSWQRHNKRPGTVPVESATLPSYRRSQNVMGAELARMRRYERSLCVLVLRLDAAVPRNNNGTDAGGKGAHGADPLVAYWEIGAVLRDVLRDSDVAATDLSKIQHVVLLPETKHEQAVQTATRIRKLVYSTTGLTVLAGVAEFPAQGLILDDLVKSAEEDCKQHQTVHGMIAQ